MRQERQMQQLGRRSQLENRLGHLVGARVGQVTLDHQRWPEELATLGTARRDAPECRESLIDRAGRLDPAVKELLDSPSHLEQLLGCEVEVRTLATGARQRLTNHSAPLPLARSTSNKSI
ncbi:hypothetical protein ACFPRL_05925 [Pseudoclavibacter helvolus]